jgi:hypothetical protein
MGAGKKQTIGYHYLFSVLMGICRGPINSLVTIMVGDKVAWDQSLCDNSPHAINKPDLFGGEKKEGGIQGPFQLFMGDEDQVLPGSQSVVVSNNAKPYGGSRTLPDVKATIGGLVSEFRGVVTLWFDGIVSSMNPYPKEWKFRLRRTTAGWFNGTWYASKATIFLEDGKIHAMNAAHIIYEASSNPQWGRGVDVAEIDNNSFTYAANKLCAERFGLCLMWYRKEDVEAFIQTVLDHVGGVLYTDRETGKLVFRLIRDDYNVNDLPLFTPDTGLIDIEEDDSQSSDSEYNEVIVTGHSPITNEAVQQRWHNLAARQANGAPATLDLNYPGLPTGELCARVAQRDGRVHGAGLKKFKVRLDRSGWRIAPGMPFRVSDPRRNIALAVLRAGEIDDGNLTSGEITVSAVQDVFGLPATSWVTPTPNTWTPPSGDALPALFSRLLEASYRDAYRERGEAVANTLDATDAVLLQVAVAPNTMSPDYDLSTRATGEVAYEVRASGSFTGTAILAAAIGPLDTSFVVDNPVDLTVDLIGQAVLIDDEYMIVSAYDDALGTLTVERGAVDTVPVAHLAGARLWTTDDDAVSDERLYTDGEMVFTKVLTRTSSDVLDDAAPESLTLVGRQGRPYPPAAVKVDGESVFALTGQHAEPIFTWFHRDRLLQGDQLLGHLDASVGPEPGTTYNVRVFASQGGALIHEQLGIVGDTWTFDAATQAPYGTLTTVWVEIESERGGIPSFQKYAFKLIINGGWGYGWGSNWGGV